MIAVWRMCAEVATVVGLMLSLITVFMKFVLWLLTQRSDFNHESLISGRFARVYQFWRGCAPRAVPWSYLPRSSKR
jgi:hypothetical protein